MLSCSLYLLDINPSWDISFAITWSHPLGGLLILSIVSVTVQNFFSLIRFCLFFFVSFAQGDISKNILLRPKSKNALFPSRCFMILGLIFESLIHYEFIYICGVRKLSSLIILCVPIQHFPTPFLEKAISHCIFLPPS